MVQQNNKEYDVIRKQLGDIHKLFFGELPKDSDHDLKNRLKAEILAGSKKHRQQHRL